VVRCLVSGVGYLDAQQAGQVDEGSATQPAGHALRRAAVTRKCPQRHARVRSVTRAATQSPFSLSSLASTPLLGGLDLAKMVLLTPLLVYHSTV